MTAEQAARTRAIARALGPFLIIFGAAVALRAGEMPLFVPAFFQDAIMVFITGAFTLALGLGLIAAHRHLTSLAAIIVTIFAVVTAIRGAVLLLAPSLISSFAAHLVITPGVVVIPAAIAIIVGAYLTFAGWLAKPAA